MGTLRVTEETLDELREDIDMRMRVIQSAFQSRAKETDQQCLFCRGGPRSTSPDKGAAVGDDGNVYASREAATPSWQVRPLAGRIPAHSRARATPPSIRTDA